LPARRVLDGLGVGWLGLAGLVFAGGSLASALSLA
jgi:hypothetical protein